MGKIVYEFKLYLRDASATSKHCQSASNIDSDIAHFYSNDLSVAFCDRKVAPPEEHSLELDRPFKSFHFSHFIFDPMTFRSLS